MSDLVVFSCILVDVVTSAAFSTLLVDERSQLSSVVDLTVMFIKVVPASKLFLLTEATTKVREGGSGFIRR